MKFLCTLHVLQSTACPNNLIMLLLLLPQGFFQKTIAKVSASIEAEAAALAGCKVEIMDLYGIVKVASIQHPMTKTAYFWLGAVNKWRFVMAKDFPEGEHSKKE